MLQQGFLTVWKPCFHKIQNTQHRLAVAKGVGSKEGITGNLE